VIRNGRPSQIGYLAKQFECPRCKGEDSEGSNRPLIPTAVRSECREGSPCVAKSSSTLFSILSAPAGMWLLATNRAMAPAIASTLSQSTKRPTITATKATAQTSQRFALPASLPRLRSPLKSHRQDGEASRIGRHPRPSGNRRTAEYDGRPTSGHAHDPPAWPNQRAAG
jgi:hypothetical protein